MFSLLWDMLSNGFLYFALHLSSGGSFPAPLSAEEERRCLLALREGDKAAKDKLINHNLRLVAHIIKKYYSSYTEQEDLISIGTIGLIKGINTFNIDKGARLATYAARCIENATPSLRLLASKKMGVAPLFQGNGVFGRK